MEILEPVWWQGQHQSSSQRNAHSMTAGDILIHGHIKHKMLPASSPQQVHPSGSLSRIP